METNKIYQGDCIEVLKDFPDESINCIITSPPYYGLRDYGVEGQIGLEPTLEKYLCKMLEITNELKRVLKRDGTMFWNHGDCYGGSGTGQKPAHKGKFTSGQFASMTTNKIFDMKNNSTLPDKCLSFQNFKLVAKMIDSQGWILRNTIIWHKPNAMPSSVKDRFNVDFEPVFFFVKNKKYYFETQYEKYAEGTKERYSYSFKDRTGKDMGLMKGMEIKDRKDLEYLKEGRNKRCVWKVNNHPFKEAHFATFPENLIEPMVKAGCPEFVCNKCGKPRERIEKVHYIKNRPSAGNDKRTKGEDRFSQANGIGGWMGNNLLKDVKFQGYTNCGCNSDFSGGIVLDPFFGAGTTGLVALKFKRQFIGIELNPKYIKIAEDRLKPHLQQTKLNIDGN